MSILEVDTDQLRASVATARQTNEAVTEACTLLDRVVVHNDWVCQERTQLNENTISNRQSAQEIQGHTSAFYRAIEQASTMFDEREQSNIISINQVEDLLSGFISVVPGIPGSLGSPSIASFNSLMHTLEEG